MVETTEFRGQSGPFVKVTRHTFAVDDTAPIEAVIDKVKSHLRQSGPSLLGEFLYKGIWVLVNPITPTETIAEGWRRDWEQRLTKPVFCLVHDSGKEAS